MKFCGLACDYGFVQSAQAVTLILAIYDKNAYIPVMLQNWSNGHDELLSAQ
jgi:hypothetical protein